MLCKHCKTQPATPQSSYCAYCCECLNNDGHLPVLCTRKLDCECEQCLEDAEDDLEAGRHDLDEDEQYESMLEAERNGFDDLDERMDGDFDSGMASAGFGTDEDYNHWEGGFDHDF